VTFNTPIVLNYKMLTSYINSNNQQRSTKCVMFTFKNNVKNGLDVLKIKSITLILTVKE